MKIIASPLSPSPEATNITYFMCILVQTFYADISKAGDILPHILVVQPTLHMW